MKLLNARTFFFASGALCAASSYAQSTVTIYGVVDEYLQVGHSSVGTTYKLESGGESGSRIGFRGSEDLGGGLKAVFTLESGIGADTGGITQGGVMWGRQSWVGLQSASLGSLTLGRQYNLNYVEMDAADPYGTGLGGMYASGILSTVGGARVNNSVSYTTPSFSGLTASAFGALGEGTTGKQWAAALRYANGPLALGGNYVRKEKFGNTQVDASSAMLSAAYNFGAFKLVGQVQDVRNLTQAINVNDDRLEYFVGAVMPMGPHRLSAMIGSGKTKNVNNRATEFSVGYQYALSKRTDLYAVASAINNDTLANYTTSGATGLGPTNVAGHDVRAGQIGIRHRF